jgi:hypothetical protein
MEYWEFYLVLKFISLLIFFIGGESRSVLEYNLKFGFSELMLFFIFVDQLF